MVKKPKPKRDKNVVLLMALRRSKLLKWLKKNTRWDWEIKAWCKRWGCTPSMLRKHVQGETPLRLLPTYLISVSTNISMEDLTLEFLVRKSLKHKIKGTKEERLFQFPIRPAKEKEVLRFMEELNNGQE